MGMRNELPGTHPSDRERGALLFRFSCLPSPRKEAFIKLPVKAVEMTSVAVSHGGYSKFVDTILIL